jgi:hypothetical protein
MTDPQLPQTHPESTSAPHLTPVGHQTPGLLIVPHTAAGVVSMKTFGPEGEPIELVHSESGKPLTWADLACSHTVAAVSGWYPGKLGGWVKLGEWRDGAFVADAWSSDGEGMKAYMKPRAKPA